MEHGRKENKMGVMPVNRLLLTMGVPMMISMLVQALYNIVDSMFVSRISEDALSALSLAFPAQNLMIAVAVGAGVGINAALSKSLGEKDFERANRAACNGLFLALLHFFVFFLLGLFFTRLFFSVQVAPNETGIIGYGTDYLRICTMASFGVFGEITAERLLQSTGRTVQAMLIQLIGAVINLVLDPILIFGLFGFPRLEVAGAAIATVLGQIIAMVVGLYLNFRHNPEIRLSFKGFRPDGDMIRRIYRVGVPTMVMNAIGSVMVFSMNQILIGFTKTATAVFGVYFKLQSFIFMPVFGLNNAIVPIISYNYGARNRDRIIRTIRLGVLYAVLLMVVGFVLFQTIPDKLLLLFDASEEMLAIGTVALRAISFSYLLAGYCIVCGSVFQAFGRGMLSLIVSLVRQLFLLLPLAYLLSLTGRLDLIWYAFPLAELGSLTASTIGLVRLYRQEIRYLTPEKEER